MNGISDNRSADNVMATQDIGQCRALIAKLAGQAVAENYYGLQDVALLIAEALSELPDTAMPAVLPELALLPGLFDQYCHGNQAAVPAIVKLLAYPGLQIALTEDELAMLAAQLDSEMIVPAAPQETEADLQWQDFDDIGDDFFAGADVLNPDAAASPSDAVLELAELLVMEAALVEQQLAAMDIENPDAVIAGLAQLAEETQRFVNAAQIAGFDGLALICGHVNANIRLFNADIAGFGAEQLALLTTWVQQVKAYLSAFSEDGAGIPLLAQLGADAWPLPISMEEAAVVLGLLQNAGAGIDGQEQEARKQTAEADDISLALPEDVNQELLDILLHELPVQTRQFSAAIHGLQAGGGMADLEVAQRVAHTVKGAANTVGIKGIAELTHCLEDILVVCAQQRQLPGNGLLRVLVDAADCLEAMTEAVTGLAPAPDEALMVLQMVLDWANRIDREGMVAINDGVEAQAGNLMAIAADETVMDAGLAEPVAEKPQAAMVRIASEQMEGLFRMGGENIILNSQANERLRRMKLQLQGMQAQFELLRQLSDELEQLLDLKDLSGRSLIEASPGFDALEMDQYNELHTASRRMVEAAFDAKEMNLDAVKEMEEMGKLLEAQQRLVNESQETLMKTRLVPVASITQRLQRSLRQTCRLTGKHCDLTVSGGQLMVDGDTLNALIDPLMHLLRNAVDHGIESGQQRLAVGKPETGNIHVGFDQEGNHVLVRVRDDGNGLDYAAIRAAAERRGTIEPGQEVSEEDLKKLILRPNFSTRTQTTQTSGRGVGMDVVYFQVLAQGGTLSLQSEQGQGLTVTMAVPLPLSLTHALLTQIGAYRLALSSKGIEQILFTAPDAFSMTDSGMRLQLDGVSYPAVTLAKLLGIPEYNRQALRTVLLVQNAGQTMAVLLAAITGSLDAVIKDFGFYIKKIPGYTGAAILGDGSVAPVVDIPELLRIAGNTDGYADYLEIADELPAAQSLPTVLVVDDSLSQRRALEQLLQDAGFQVSTARDGMEASGQLSRFRPDIVLTDLEMPRMNGIELAVHIRARENLKDLPIIMITSRTTQTHRKMAESAGIDLYLVKPVREDDLLINIQNLMTAV